MINETAFKYINICSSSDTKEYQLPGDVSLKYAKEQRGVKYNSRNTGKSLPLDVIRALKIPSIFFIMYKSQETEYNKDVL